MTNVTTEPGNRRWSRRKITFAVLLGIGFLLAVYSFVIEPNRLVIRQASINLPSWPAELQGMRIAAISDLHAGAPYISQEKLRQLVELTNAQQPDLILLAGDFVIQRVLGGKFMEPAAMAGELKHLKARQGVFATLGNHDWWYNAARVRVALEEAGIRVLDNQAIKIEQNGKPL